MSRVYPGSYRVMVVVDADGEPLYGFTEPAAYEDCERACVLFGWGAPYEGRRVMRALVVGPVHGRHAPEPGTDFAVERITQRFE